MHMGTTRWAVAGMGIGSTDTTLSVTQLSTAAQSAALAPRKEAPSVIPGSSSRSADVYLANWMRGQLAALDIRHIYHAAANTSWSFHYSRICPASGGGKKDGRPFWGLPGCWCHFHPPLSWNLWEAGEKRPSRPLKALVSSRGNIWGFPHPKQRAICSSDYIEISLWKGNALLWVRRQPACSATVDGIV